MRRAPHWVFSVKRLDRGSGGSSKKGWRKVTSVSAVILCFVHWRLSRAVDVPVGCRY